MIVMTHSRLSLNKFGSIHASGTITATNAINAPMTPPNLSIGSQSRTLRRSAQTLTDPTPVALGGFSAGRSPRGDEPARHDRPVGISAPCRRCGSGACPTGLGTARRETLLVCCAFLGFHGARQPGAARGPDPVERTLSQPGLLTHDRANGSVLRLAEEALPISVRTATAADAPAIAVIGQVAFPALHEHIVGAEFSAAVVAQTYSIEALNDCIARCASADDAEFLVAERGGTVVGYLHYDCEGMEPELHRIYVDPALKRSGIGSALMDDLHARLPLGCSYVLLVAEENESAQRF